MMFAFGEKKYYKESKDWVLIIFLLEQVSKNCECLNFQSPLSDNQ